MQSILKELISSCIPCLSTGGKAPVQQAKTITMPNKPWEKLHLDFKGPLPSGKYIFALTDRYSRYPELEVLQSVAADIVIKKLRKSFASHGVPNVLVTYNGPPFHSNKFNELMEEFKIAHQFSTPCWPQGNAEIERFKRTLGKIVVISAMRNDDLEISLSTFLLDYRSTPHCTTKVSPAELLYNRKLNRKLPSIDRGPVEKHQISKVNEQKARNYNKSYVDNTRRINRTDDVQVCDWVLDQTDSKQ